MYLGNNAAIRGCQEYFNRLSLAGTQLLENDRRLIIDFAIGLDQLGLWNSMVCWPLRSTQNAGTGTTAYSLGGLGIFNGTLTSSGALPSWGQEGITFTNGPTQYISFGGSQIIGGNSDYTVMGIARLINVAAASLSFISLGNNRGGLIGVASNGSTQIRNAHWTVSGGFITPTANGPTTSMFSGFASGDATNAKSYVNSGAPYNTATGDYRVNPTPTTTAEIGALNLNPTTHGGSFNGPVAAGAMWNVKLTDAQVASVLSLYKQTLGIGLGLP